MAFDIMSLFSPQARNMLLQPMATNPDNLLIAPQMQNYPVAGIPQNALANPQASPVPQNVPMPAPMPPQMQQPSPQPQQAPQMAAAQPQQHVDPMMTGATQQGPAPMAPAPQQGGLGSFFTPERKQSLNDFFTGLAAGTTPQQSLALGAAAVSKGSNDRSDQNDTEKWLTGRGVDPYEAKTLARSPTALNEYLKATFQKPQGEFRQLSTDEIKARNLDPTRSYQVGTDGKVDVIGGGGITINNGDGGEKLPANTRWLDPNNHALGVEPIPGGPGEQLPADVAGRIGMADSFISQVPDIKKSVSNGDVTGIWDYTMATKNSGSPQASTYRKIQSGTDALTRMLTGAGKSQQEAEDYAMRYLPTRTDTAASVADKVDQLQKELESSKKAVMLGRGGHTPSSSGADPLGIR